MLEKRSNLANFAFLVLGNIPASLNGKTSNTSGFKRYQLALNFLNEISRIDEAREQRSEPSPASL